MNIKKLLVTGAALSMTTVMGLTPVFAQGAPPPPDVAPLNVQTSKAGFRIDNIGTLVPGILNMVMFIAALLVFAYMVWGGIQWITSGGDKSKTEEARNKITAAIIGLAVLAASYAIFLLVLRFLGVGNPLDNSWVIPTAWNADQAGNPTP